MDEKNHIAFKQSYEQQSCGRKQEGEGVLQYMI